VNSVAKNNHFAESYATNGTKGDATLYLEVCTYKMPKFLETLRR